MTCKEKILSEDYADILVSYTLSENLLPLHQSDSCYVRLDGDIGVVYLSLAEAGELQLSPLTYRSIPKIYGLMIEGPQAVRQDFDQLSLIASGITSVQNPPLSLTGRGIVLGFLDTGIDYTLPVFRRSDGSSRILTIWDQTIQDGEPPEGFLYGTEYTREEIDRTLASEDPRQLVPTRDEIGHGTSMASVAAGSSIDDGRTFTGAAPEADIIMVKLRPAKEYLRDYYQVPEGVPAYSETDILFALKYLNSFLAAFERPVVICNGLGTNMGDHEGSSILSTYMDYLAGKRSMGLINAGGNEGNSAAHYHKVLPALNGASSASVEFRVAENTDGFIMEFWGTSPARFSVSLRSPGGERVPEVTFRTTQSVTYRFIYESTVITIHYILVEQGSGEQLIFFRFQDPTPGIWTLNVTNETQNVQAPFNIWLPITQFVTSGTGFLESTPYTTLTEPGYAARTITVSTYNDKNDSFYIASGRGYSREGMYKPDLAAPGVDIATINGRQTGSSLAAAITAGAVAQFMQWAILQGNDPLIDNNDVKSYFVRGATRSNGLTYPNREFGFGLLNLRGVFDALVE